MNWSKDLSRELEKRYLLVFEQGEIKIGKQFLSFYRFSHALTQQYLYDELGAGERRMLHGEIAETLEALSADHSQTSLPCNWPAIMTKPAMPKKPIPIGSMAGDAAFAIYAQNEAIAAYTRALELSKEAAISSEQLHHLYTCRGRAMELIGQFEQALKNYDEMLTAARERKDRRMELDAQVASSTLYSTPTAVMDPERARRYREETLKLAEELGDQSIECRVLWNLLLANLHGEQRGPGHGLRGEILELSHVPWTCASRSPTRSPTWAGLTTSRAGSKKVEARLMEAAGLWRELGNMPMLSDNLNTLLLNLVWSGKYEKALEIAQESLEVSRTTKNIWAQCWPRHLQGQIWFEYGEIDRAFEELEASVRLAEEANAPIHIKWYGADSVLGVHPDRSRSKRDGLVSCHPRPKPGASHAPGLDSQRQWTMLFARSQPGSSTWPPPLSAHAASATPFWTMR